MDTETKEPILLMVCPCHIANNPSTKSNKALFQSLKPKSDTKELSEDTHFNFDYSSKIIYILIPAHFFLNYSFTNKLLIL